MMKPLTIIVECCAPAISYATRLNTDGGKTCAAHKREKARLHAHRRPYHHGISYCRHALTVTTHLHLLLRLPLMTFLVQSAGVIGESASFRKSPRGSSNASVNIIKSYAQDLHFLIPFVDRIAYIHNLKEQPISISNQQAITMDNVTINIDGVLYLKINNPELASYGVSRYLLRHDTT